MFLNIDTYLKFLVFLFLFVSFSCIRKPIPKAWKMTCYSFDQRQCMADPWAEKIPLDISNDQKEERMMEFLEHKNIDVIRMKVKSDFHEVVCNECKKCPYPHRFFMEINDRNILELKRLRLLNLEECDCRDF